MEKLETNLIRIIGKKFYLGLQKNIFQITEKE